LALETEVEDRRLVDVYARPGCGADHHCLADLAALPMRLWASRHVGEIPDDPLTG